MDDRNFLVGGVGSTTVEMYQTTRYVREKEVRHTWLRSGQSHRKVWRQLGSPLAVTAAS